MELQHGMPVLRGKPIGYLHREVADLTVAKAKVAVEGKAAEAKADAQRELAVAIVATNVRLNLRRPGMVSQEEMRKNEAEVKVAEEMKNVAREKRELDRADLNLARQALEDHTIKAPFDGVVIERLKNPGESVRAGDPVVRLANMDKLRAWAYVPLEYAFRVKEGQVVDLQLKVSGPRGSRSPVEHKRFRGKITFVDPEVQAVAETAVRIFADFDNPDHELRPGLKAVLTIYLGSEPAPANTAVGVRTPRTPGGLGR